MTPFIKLASDFNIDWNIDDIISKISNDVVDPNNNISPYFHPSGIAHWQHYPRTNISFARHFYRNFPLECMKVTIKLRELQQAYAEISTDDELILSFINHRIMPLKVNIIRTIGGKNVEPHSDITRDICINIGLYNSNLFKTRMSDTIDTIHFYDTPTNDFIMNDGDVYLLSIKNAHCVESLITTAEPRYIITYTLK